MMSNGRARVTPKQEDRAVALRSSHGVYRSPGLADPNLANASPAEALRCTIRLCTAAMHPLSLARLPGRCVDDEAARLDPGPWHATTQDFEPFPRMLRSPSAAVDAESSATAASGSRSARSARRRTRPARRRPADAPGVPTSRPSTTWSRWTGRTRPAPPMRTRLGGARQALIPPRRDAGRPPRRPHSCSPPPPGAVPGSGS